MNLYIKVALNLSTVRRQVNRVNGNLREEVEYDQSGKPVNSLNDVKAKKADFLNTI